jgi:hypothetical protein
MPIFLRFKKISNTAEKISARMKIPGGKIKGVTSFFKKNIKFSSKETDISPDICQPKMKMVAIIIIAYFG